MRRILIVADRLLGGAELRERLALKKSTDPEIEVFVLVPAAQRGRGDAGGDRSAERILELELAVLRDLQYDVDGAVGEADPLAARGRSWRPGRSTRSSSPRCPPPARRSGCGWTWPTGSSG